MSNGTLVEWQFYNNKENRIYNKISKSDTIFWQNASNNEDEIISWKVNKGVTEVEEARKLGILKSRKMKLSSPVYCTQFFIVH